MIISNISGILIDSSLLKKIDLNCLREKCHHMGCCCDTVKLNKDDIEKIVKALPSIIHFLTPEREKYVSTVGFTDIDNKIKMVSDTKTRWNMCIFSVEGKCLLEQFNAVPLLCKTYPLTLDDNILKLNLSLDLPCHVGDTKAYKLLENEINMLTSHIDKDFYKKLSQLLSSDEFKDLFFRNI